LLAGGQAVLVDRVVAVVGTHAITRSQLQLRMRSSRLPERQALQRLIEDRLIQNDCQRLGVTLDLNDIDRAIQEVTERHGITQAELVDELKQQGMSMDEYREDVRVQLLQMKWSLARVGSPKKGESEKDYFVRSDAERTRLVQELWQTTVVEVRI
jgi:peptidyl-prolyl cis-trans isomerase SurA